MGHMTATPPDLECGVAPLRPPAPVQLPLLGCGVAPLGHHPNLGCGVGGSDSKASAYNAGDLGSIPV